MSKKLYFLISFVLVLSLAGNVLAYDSMIWDNDAGNGDQLWDTATNWKVAGQTKVPAPADWVELAASGMGDANNGPIINSDMNATCMWLDYGYYKAGNEVILTMTGGTFTSTSWFAMGYYQGGDFRFDLSGGTANFGQVVIGERADSGTYTHNISGGTLNASGIELGIGVTTQCDINMTGGDVNVAGWLNIGAYGALAWWDEVLQTTGEGHLDLHGGTLEVGYLGMGGGGEGTMDIAGGTLIIDGDYRVPNGWLFDPCSDDDPNFEGTYTGTIAILAKRGLITAYGVELGEIITDDINHPSEADLRAVLNLDYDVTNPGQTTITAGAVDPNLAFNPDPLHFNGDLPASDINLISWQAGDNAVKHDVYFGTSFAEVNDANNSLPVGTSAYKGNQALADVNYQPASLTWNQTCYWRIDEVNDSNVPQWGKGRVWHFATRSASARNPSPTGGSAALYPILTWDSGPLVQATAGHYVYLSSDFNDVNDRDPSVRTIRDINNYSPPGILAFDTQYWWAVDEINDSEDPCTWPSLNWSFTTENHLFVDNMESYASEEDIKDVWMDWSSFDTRSDIYIETSAARVRNGDTSMRFNYINDKTQQPADDRGYSEAWANPSDLWAGTNWTITGAKALVLYFRGKTTNTEPQPMYLILADGAGNEGMVTYDDESSIQEESWHPWYIDLNDSNFTTGATPGPVDMTDVNQIWLGIGVKGLTVTNVTGGGFGDVYFDDIGLYPSMCFPEQVVDITGDDCITNYRDLDIMGRDWLMSDYNVPAVAISGDPCGLWRFDEGHPSDYAYDTSGYGNDGTIIHATWMKDGGYPDPNSGEPNGHSLHFDGDQIATYDRVVCAERINEGNQVGDYPAELMPDTFTVACWVKVDSFDYSEGLVSNGTDYAMEETGFYLYSSGFSPGFPGLKNFGLMISTEEELLSFVETESNYNTDTWYHLAATYNDANMVNIYVDGELVPSGLARYGVGPRKTLAPTDVGGPMRWTDEEDKYPANFLIGAFWFGDDEQFWYYGKATIDDVRVYGYGMPYGEIVTLAEQGPVLYHDLISPAELYDLEPQTQRKVNFRDYRILADLYLTDPILWPN